MCTTVYLPLIWSHWVDYRHFVFITQAHINIFVFIDVGAEFLMCV